MAASAAAPEHDAKPVSEAASASEPQPTPVTLMHAPDDPGPDRPPAPETEETKPEPKQEGWWRTLFG
jgi:hypothetical protein